MHTCSHVSALFEQRASCCRVFMTAQHRNTVTAQVNKPASKNKGPSLSVSYLPLPAHPYALYISHTKILTVPKQTTLEVR